MLLDVFIFVMIKHRIIRSEEHCFTHQDMNELTAQTTDYFFKLQEASITTSETGGTYFKISTNSDQKEKTSSLDVSLYRTYSQTGVF